MNQRLSVELATTLWAGVVVGVSFLAQPAKFRTPQLDRTTALATGRQIFRTLHISESVLACAAILLMLASGRSEWPVFAGAAILLLQLTALMPPLSRRVDARLAGVEPPASLHHAAFAVLEVAKLALLLAIPANALFS